jgi:hypothetical protein
VSEPPHEAEATVEAAKRTRSEVKVVREVMRLQSCAVIGPSVNLAGLSRHRASASKRPPPLARRTPTRGSASRGEARRPRRSPRRSG